MGLFNKCKHDYNILKQFEIESQAEKLTKLGLHLTKGGPVALKSKLIIVYKCSKCNQIKESVHTNFSGAWD